MIKELELSNKDDFIERFDHLYQEITGEYNFGYNKTEKINVQRHAKRTCSFTAQSTCRLAGNSSK